MAISTFQNLLSPGGILETKTYMRQGDEMGPQPDFYGPATLRNLVLRRTLPSTNLPGGVPGGAPRRVTPFAMTLDNIPRFLRFIPE